MIIFVASLSVMVTYAVMAQLPLFKDVNKPVTLQKATPIDPEIAPGDTADEKVDPTIFNDKALNPTVKITIGESKSTQQEQ